MYFTAENIILLGSILLFISVLTSKTSLRLGIPTLLLFILIGILAGSEGLGGINFDNPKTAQFLSIVALNFILFSGGMDTRKENVMPILTQGVLLSTLGVLLTAVSVGVFVWLVSDRFSLIEGLLLGSIISSTDAAAIFPLFRREQSGLKHNLRPTLEFESGSNDPMAYFLTMGFLMLVQNPDQSILSLIPLFLRGFVLGGAAGIICGRLIVLIINNIKLDIEGLYLVLMISLAFITQSLTELIGGNGFLAVYVAGILVGNCNLVHKRDILQSFEGFTWLMQIVMFLTLGLLVFPSQIFSVLGTGLVISVFLLLIARPFAVFVCTLFFKRSFRDKIFLSWGGLRGAAPIIFATYPMVAGIPIANTLFHLVFFVSLTSVLLQGSTLIRVAKKLNLTIPETLKKRYVLQFSNNKRSMLEEVQIERNSPVIGKAIVHLKIPESVLIVMINRNGEYFTPNGSTVLQEDDLLFVLAENTDKIRAFIEITRF